MNKQEQTPISNFEAATIKNAVMTYKFLMRIPKIVDGKKIYEKLTDFSLGELAGKIRTKIKNKDVIAKEMYDTLRKHKDEVVTLA